MAHPYHQNEHEKLIRIVETNLSHPDFSTKKKSIDFFRGLLPDYMQLGEDWYYGTQFFDLEYLQTYNPRNQNPLSFYKVATQSSLVIGSTFWKQYIQNLGNKKKSVPAFPF